jgi:alkylation response protein AidB-like acyl-CoA dehydrogenase
MSSNAALRLDATTHRTPADIARELGPVFAERAESATDEDKFVADNFAALKAAGLVEAGVPTELGGGGAFAADRGFGRQNPRQRPARRDPDP